MPDAPVADVPCVGTLTLGDCRLALVASKIVLPVGHGWFRHDPSAHRHLVAFVAANDHQTAAGSRRPARPAASVGNAGHPPQDG